MYLQTDASEYALGAVLYQINEKNEHEVLQFANRTLKGAELTYFTTGKELLEDTRSYYEYCKNSDRICWGKKFM